MIILGLRRGLFGGVDLAKHEDLIPNLELPTALREGQQHVDQLLV